MDSVNNNVMCTAAGYGHTHTVMAVAFFKCVLSFMIHLLVDHAVMQFISFLSDAQDVTSVSVLFSCTE